MSQQEIVRNSNGTVKGYIRFDHDRITVLNASSNVLGYELLHNHQTYNVQGQVVARGHGSYGVLLG